MNKKSNVNATETKNVALKEWLAASKELEKYSSNPFCEEFKAAQIRFDNAIKAYYADFNGAISLEDNYVKHIVDYESEVDGIYNGVLPLQSVGTYISLAKALIDEYQYAAFVCLDNVLAERYAECRKRLDTWVYKNLNEDDVCNYYYALD